MLELSIDFLPGPRPTGRARIPFQPTAGRGRAGMTVMRALTAVLTALALVAIGGRGAHATETPGQRCSSAKSKAAAKQVAAKLKCYENATQRGVAVDSTCLTSAEMRFRAAFAKADAGGGCVVSEDLGVVDVVAQTCVNEIVARTPAASCGTFLTAWGSFGTGNGQFGGRIAVAVDASGNVFISDSANSRIQKFDNFGNFRSAWGSFGSGNGQFSVPDGVAVDANGNVFVVDFDNSRIQKFDNFGNFLTVWRSFAQFNPPGEVAVDASGNVFVTEPVTSHIAKFDDFGNFLTVWGGFGGSNGQFNVPGGLAVDASGNVFVTDSNNDRIEKFDNNGGFLTAWGSTGDGNGQFITPIDIGVDANGNVFVTDMDRIQEFDNAGNFLADVTNGVLNPGPIAVDASGNVFVAVINEQIQKFACPSLGLPGLCGGQGALCGKGSAGCCLGLGLACQVVPGGGERCMPT